MRPRGVRRSGGPGDGNVREEWGSRGVNKEGEWRVGVQGSEQGGRRRGPGQ